MATDWPPTALHVVHAPGSPFARVMEMLRRVGASGSNAILYGASGTGKEALARLVHACGRAAREPFVAVPCAGRGEPAVTAELFSDGGALLSDAGSGTLFLEDVGELPLALQARLVRALDAAAGRPLRIVAASTRELFPDVAAGRFRRDLFDFLACPVHVPPLRDRRDDILAIFDRCWSDVGRGLQMTRAARALLSEYPWPGNVREVDALARRLAATCTGAAIGVREIEEALLAASYGGAWVIARSGRGGELLAGGRADCSPALSIEMPAADGDGIDLVAVLRRVETDLIRWALERSGGRKTAAAQLLGLRRTTLAEKLRRLDPPTAVLHATAEAAAQWPQGSTKGDSP